MIISTSFQVASSWNVTNENNHTVCPVFSQVFLIFHLFCKLRILDLSFSSLLITVFHLLFHYSRLRSVIAFWLSYSLSLQSTPLPNLFLSIPNSAVVWLIVSDGRCRSWLSGLFKSWSMPVLMAYGCRIWIRLTCSLIERGFGKRVPLKIRWFLANKKSSDNWAWSRPKFINF